MAPYSGSAKRSNKMREKIPIKRVHSTASANSQIETRTRKSLKSLFRARSVNSFAKLHRLDKLVVSILTGCREALNGTLVDFVPDKFSKKWCNSFEKHISTLATSQIFSILKAILFSLEQDCVVLLESNPQDTSCLKMLPVVSQLLNVYLPRVNMAEHTVPGRFVSEFVQNMTDFESLLGRLGCALMHKEHDDTLMIAFLRCCLSWGDMNTLLLFYRSQDMPANKKPTQVDYSATNLSSLHPYLSSDQWSLIAQRITNFGDMTSKSILNQLVLQKLEALILFDGQRKSNEMSAAAKHLVSASKEAWTQLLGHIDFQRTSLVDSTILLELTSVVVSNIGRGDMCVEKALQIPSVQENRPLIYALMVVTLKEILTNLLSTKQKGPIFKMVKGACEDLDCFSFNDPNSQAWTNITSRISTRINVFLETNQQLSTPAQSSIDFPLLERYLEILRVLPFEYMPDDYQTISLLCVMTFALGLESLEPDDVETKKRILQQLYHDVILGFFAGINPPNVMTNLHPGLLVQWLLRTELFLCEKKRRSLFQCIFKMSLKEEESLRLLEVGLPFLLTQGFMEKHQPLHVEPAALLLQALRKVSHTNLSEDHEALCRQIQRKLTRYIMSVIKHSDMTANDSSSNKLLVEVFHGALQMYIGKKNKTKLSKLTPFLNAVLQIVFKGLERGDEESLALVQTLLKNRDHLQGTLPTDFILITWTCLEKCSNSMALQKSLLESATSKQFSQITSELLTTTMNSTSAKSTTIEEFATLWTSVVVCNLDDLKSKTRQSVLVKLCNFLLIEAQMGHVTDSKHLLTFILALAKRVQVSLGQSMLDCCLDRTTRISADNLSSVELALDILGALLKHRTAQILDVIPAFLQRYFYLAAIVAKRGCQDETNQDLKHNQLIETCASNVEKLANSMVKHKTQLKRVASYAVAEILHHFEVYTLSPDVKLHFMNTVYSFLSICDEYAVGYLTHALPPASKQIFQTFYSNYTKFYRFTGKV